tara:strand:- start:1908 stop:2363 length:456 start_codon:yes stop_codon:yes gene_type:complete
MKRSCLVVLMSLATLGSVFGQEFLSFTYQPFGYGKLDLSMLESEGFNRVLTLRNTDTTGEGFVAVDFYFTDLGSSNDTIQLLGIGIQSLIFESKDMRIICSPYKSVNTISLSREILYELKTRSEITPFVLIEKGEEAIIKVSLALKFLIEK